MDRLSSQAEHLRSQNAVLELTLEDSKSLTDRLTVMMGKFEANNTALQLALGYCDHMIESYDVLVALLETEAGVLAAAASPGGGFNCDSLASKRASSNRRSAEVVAKHLLSRMDRSFKRADSGIGRMNSTSSANSSAPHWEDSSGYSHTTRYEKTIGNLRQIIIVFH